MLYAGGKLLGSWADVDGVIEAALKAGPVEFRSETGVLLARTMPVRGGSPAVDGDSPQDKCWIRSGTRPE